MVVSLPLFTLLPGLGSFGTNKTQGLFCGLEYLEDEPSSSEADIIGPESKRQVPDPLKITFPLMAIAAQNRYIGLLWQPETNVRAVFDSPDRILGSTGHLMGLIFPGAIRRQEDNVLLASRGVLVRANEPVLLQATIIGGQGDTVIPALKQYVALRGLPPLPGPVPPAAGALLGLVRTAVCLFGFFSPRRDWNLWDGRRLRRRRVGLVIVW